MVWLKRTPGVRAKEGPGAPKTSLVPLTVLLRGPPFHMAPGVTTLRFSSTSHPVTQAGELRPQNNVLSPVLQVGKPSPQDVDSRREPRRWFHMQRVQYKR